jgi:hypothetical protein
MRTVFRSGTKPTPSTAASPIAQPEPNPDVSAEQADQTAKSSAKQVRNVRVKDLSARALQAPSDKDKVTIQANLDSKFGVLRTEESPSSGKQLHNAEVTGLWADALQTLPDMDKATILQSDSAFHAHFDSNLDVLQHIRLIAERKRDDCENRGWKFELHGRQIILRDVAQKIIVWISKFKEVGDVAANFDPVHLSLPWAGIRFLLQVRMKPIGFPK